MDRTASKLVSVIRYSGDRKRYRDAGNTLMGILPSIDDDSFEDIICNMTNIIRYDKDENRRSVAQDVLVCFKNAQSIGF